MSKKKLIRVASVVGLAAVVLTLAFVGLARANDIGAASATEASCGEGCECEDCQCEDCNCGEGECNCGDDCQCEKCKSKDCGCHKD